MKKTILTIFIVSTIVFFVAPYFSFAQDVSSGEISCGQAAKFKYPWCKEASNLAGVVKNIYLLSLAFVGVLAFGVLVYAAILWMTSGGNASKKAEALDYIKGAILGVLLLLGAVLLLRQINPKLIKLQPPEKSLPNQAEIKKAAKDFSLKENTSAPINSYSASFCQKMINELEKQGYACSTDQEACEKGFQRIPCSNEEGSTYWVCCYKL